MPLFAGLFIEALTSVAAWLATWLTQRVALATAATALYTGLLVALYAAVTALLGACLNGLSTSGLGPMFGAGVSMVISPRTVTLLTGYVGFWSLCELYKAKTTLMVLWTGRL